jgi:hypothetical protein
VGTARNRKNDQVGRVEGSRVHRRTVDAVQRDGGQVLRVPARFVDRARLLRVAAREGHIVPTIRKQPSEGGAPGTGADNDRLHERLTKSIATGTPSSSKRSRT